MGERVRSEQMLFFGGGYVVDTLGNKSVGDTCIRHPPQIPLLYMIHRFAYTELVAAMHAIRNFPITACWVAANVTLRALLCVCLGSSALLSRSSAHDKQQTSCVLTDCRVFRGTHGHTQFGSPSKIPLLDPARGRQVPLVWH